MRRKDGMCKCYGCGELFVVEDSTGYAYKTRGKLPVRWFCSWHCLRKYQRERGQIK